MAEQKLEMGTGGTFTAITQFVAPTLPTAPRGMIIVNKKYLYIASATGEVFGYSIDPTTGFLTSVSNNIPYAVAGGNSIVADPSGGHLFVGDVVGEQISVFTINSTNGTLTAVSGSPFATSGMMPTILAVDGLSKYLYANDAGAAGFVGAYSIGSTGALTVVPTYPINLGLSTIATETSGKFVFGATGVANAINVYSIGSTGGITPVANSPFTTTYTVFTLSVHPSGSWIYSFGNVTPIEGFGINSSTGALTQISGSPFNSLSAAAGPFEQSGQFMFGLGLTSGNGGSDSFVTPYNTDLSTGALSDSLGSLGFPGTDQAIYVVTDAQ